MIKLFNLEKINNFSMYLIKRITFNLILFLCTLLGGVVFSILPIIHTLLELDFTKAPLDRLFLKKFIKRFFSNFVFYFKFGIYFLIGIYVIHSAQLYYTVFLDLTYISNLFILLKFLFVLLFLNIPSLLCKLKLKGIELFYNSFYMIFYKVSITITRITIVYILLKISEILPIMLFLLSPLLIYKLLINLSEKKIIYIHEEIADGL